MSNPAAMAPEQNELQRKLLEAVKGDDVSAMDQLLAEGADPTLFLADDGQEMNYLAVAAREGNQDAVRVLLNWGADANAANQDGKTAMHFLSLAPNRETMHQLLEVGGRFDVADKGGATAYGNVEAMLDHADITDGCLELMNEYRNMPRINASNDPQNLKARLFKEHSGSTPLDNPDVWQRFESVGKALLEQGTPITKQEMLDIQPDGDSILLKAAKARQLNHALKHLREQGDPLTVKDLRESPNLLTDLCHFGGVKALFSFPQLKDEGVSGMYALRQSVDEASIAMVPNMHSLRARLEQEQAQQLDMGRA